MVFQPFKVKNKNYKALLFAGAITGLNNFELAETPATEEFCNSSPTLIISSVNKSIGIEKYADTKCVCAVKNHVIRPADLLSEVISNVKAGKSYDLRLPNNHGAGTN